MSQIDIVRAALFTPLRNNRWGLPIILESDPGMAKSSLVTEIANACGLRYELLAPGERGEAAFGTVPVPENGYLGYPPPTWTKKFEQNARGLVFVDELPTAPPALQPALLGLVLDGRIGNHYLGNNVRICAAGNDPTQCGGYGLPLAVKNRLGWIRWEGPDHNQWAGFMAGGCKGTTAPVDAEKLEEKVLEAWGDSWARAVGYAIGFTKKRSDLFHKPSETESAWPSRRTWEFAARALASSKCHSLNDIDTQQFVAAFIGNAAAIEFFSYLENEDLQDPKEIIFNGEKFRADYKRLDRICASLMSCTTVVLAYYKDGANSADLAPIRRMYEILNGVSEKAPDIVYPALQALAQNQLAKNTHGADTVLARFGEMAGKLS